QLAVSERGDYCLRDAGRTHTLVFPATAGKFPRARFDDFRGREVTIAATVDRPALAHTAFLARSHSRSDHVIFTFKKLARGWELQVSCPESAGGNLVTNALAAAVQMDQPPGADEVTFAVNTSHLLLALQRAGGVNEVLLTYRGGVSLLGV